MIMVRSAGEEFRVSREDVLRFKAMYFDRLPMAERIADLLVLDAYVYELKKGTNPEIIIQEIQRLEAGEKEGPTKKASPFSRPPLKGLWHKHFFSAAFMFENIEQGLKHGLLEKIIYEENQKPGAAEKSDEWISEVSRRLTEEPYEKRYDTGNLTGEWIIFAKHKRQNFYLCLNTHNAGDDFIVDRLKSGCQSQFPQLKFWQA